MGLLPRKQAIYYILVAIFLVLISCQNRKSSKHLKGTWFGDRLTLSQDTLYFNSNIRRPVLEFTDSLFTLHNRFGYEQEGHYKLKGNRIDFYPIADSLISNELIWHNDTTLSLLMSINGEKQELRLIKSNN